MAYKPDIVRVPQPATFEDAKDDSPLAKAESIAATAEVIFQRAQQSGQTIAVPDADAHLARHIFNNPDRLDSVQTTATAIHLTALLQEYDHTVVSNAQQIRNLCTNILIEKATKGKTEQVQLRAVELLGKIKDVGLFEERSTVVVEQMPTEEIKKRLLEKLGAIYQRAQPITDVTPKEES